MGHFRNLTRRALPVLLLAMLFGALAPRGFMPHFGPNGLTIELCSGLGNKATTISRDDPRYQDYARLAAARAGQQPDHSGDDDADNPMPPCAFAGLGLLAVPVDAIVVPDMVTTAAVPPALHHQLLRARHHAATPPATGPPSFL